MVSDYKGLKQLGIKRVEVFLTNVDEDIVEELEPEIDRLRKYHSHLDFMCSS